MLYNIEKKKIKQPKDCFSCECYDKKELKCTGLNKVCFEFDETTYTVIDGLSKLPIKIIKEN